MDAQPLAAETAKTNLETQQRLDEYRSRLAARQALAVRLARSDVWFGLVRLLLVVCLLALAWWWHTHRIAAWWMVLPVLCFVPVAALQTRRSQRRKQAQRGTAVYTAGLARMEDRWQGLGQQEPRGSHEGSLFAADLDLFGKQSLFALLSTARTRMGEDTLADWLLRPAAPPQVPQRQAAVQELRGRLDLHEDVAVLGADAGSAVRPRELVSWAEEPLVLARGRVAGAALALALLVVAAAVLWLAMGLRWPVLVLLAIVGGVHMAHRRRVNTVVAGADRALADLELLSGLLARLERESFTAPLLCTLQSRLRAGEKAASQAIARLRTIGAYIDARDNLFVRVANVPLLYIVQAAYAAERWRRRYGSEVRTWLAALGELEALLSIATYSYEHPEDPFPEIAAEAETGAPLFAAEGLGHPLLPTAHAVRNDLRLDAAHPILLISGSNMSGKSTLLRAVGLNTVLAMAGAPVRARQLRLSPVEVGASILVNDSLAEGASRFYAEIRRLRAICDLASHAAEGAPPLLFLLDELLEGTNSHDRRIGAEGILHTLAKRGAIGMVTTHDLALTAGHDDLALVNRHFEDQVRDGRMHFDYTLRDGVVTRSNGVALMRMVGLDV